MSDNVIDFNKIKNKNNEIQYDENMDLNPYFKLTFENALSLMELPITTETVYKIQEELELEKTGIVSIMELLYVSFVFDPNTRQDIVNKVDRYIENGSYKIGKNKKKSRSDIALIIRAVIISIIFITFFVWGVIDCWILIWHAVFG